LEQPSQDNDYTVRLRIEDSRVGEGRYHARLRWKWEAMAPASANPRYPGHPPAGTELTSTDNDPSKYKQDNQGLFEFRGRVDGVVVLRIRGDRGYAEVLSGAPVQVERFSFSQPLPSVPLKEIKVEKKDGRGEVTLLDQPSIANDNTAAVQVTDLKGGAGRYHFGPRCIHGKPARHRTNLFCCNRGAPKRPVKLFSPLGHGRSKPTTECSASGIQVLVAASARSKSRSDLM
jgi:hypothetical protein